MVHADTDVEDDMLPELSSEEIADRNEIAARRRANYLYNEQQKEFQYKGSLENALYSLFHELRKYVDACNAIQELSAAVVHWKAVATPEERLQCANLENRIIMQVHDIRHRGVQLPI
jgi:hypothetical protein